MAERRKSPGMSPQTEDQATLADAVETLIAEDQVKFGFGESALIRARRVLAERGAHDRLFPELEAAIGVPLSTPQRFLEVGCGTATFLYSMLERGHDAYGIDNSERRLAVAHAKIPVYGYPAEWQQRIRSGDASKLDFDSNFFDIVMGHQFIEHVSDVGSVLYELARVTKPGGAIVLWAPDYRGPFEAHYEMPWPPFASRPVAELWLECFERPTGGIGEFNYITLPQIASIIQALNCEITVARLDQEIDLTAQRWFDASTPQTLRESARNIQAAGAGNALPPQLLRATSFAITARKR